MWGGWDRQGATSHCLGQNFGKMFHIEFEDEKGQKQIPWQNRRARAHTHTHTHVGVGVV